MLGTVLHVLSIIGTVLLVILAILIVLILFVAFAPLKYKFVVKYNAYADTNNICFVKLSWLWHIVKFRADISREGMDYTFRLFGFKSKLLDKYLDKDSDDEIDDYEELDDSLVTFGSSIDETIDDKIHTSLDEDDYNKYNYNKDNSNEDNMHTDIENGMDRENNSKDNQLLDEIEQIWEDLISDNEDFNDDYTEEKDNKKGKWKKIFTTNPFKLFTQFIKEIIKHIKNIIKGIINTIKSLVRKYELVMELLEKKSTIAAIERIKRYVSKLCSHIKPKKAKIRLNIGFEDPSKTGYILGAIGTIYGFIGKIIDVRPNFEDEELDVDVLIAGRMRVFNLGIIGFRIMKDKAIKILTKNIGKLKEDIGNGR